MIIKPFLIGGTLILALFVSCSQDNDLLAQIIPIIAQQLSTSTPREGGVDNCLPVKDTTALFAADTNTIALWRFNEALGNTTADASGKNHGLSLINNPLWIAGTYGSALQFSSNYCTTPYSADLFPQSITVEALVWVDSGPQVPASPRPHSMIVSTVDWSGSDTKGYELRLDNNNVVDFIIGTGLNGWQNAVSSQPLQVGRWYRLAGQFDGSAIKLFVDGVCVATTSCTSPMKASGTALTVAKRVLDQPFYFYGKVDEIRISKTARY